MLKRVEGSENGTKIGVLVWRPKAEARRRSKEFTGADKIHDIFTFAEEIRKKGASEIKLILHLNRLKFDGRSVSFKDNVVDDLRHALRKHGIEESIIHF